MRRSPSSWKTVLAQLGFKRKRRKLPEGRGRRSRLESLESRELLSVSPGIDENPPLVDEVAAASPGPLPVPVAFGEDYTILESEARSLFEVTTARDADGGGYALLSWKEGAAPEAGVTYKFTIESRLGSTVTGRQAVTVWLPTQEFVDALDTGRSEEAERPATTKAATPGATNISVALGSTRGYAPTVDDAKLRATAGLAAALTPGQLSKADTLQLYADLETALNTPRPADPLKALEGDDLGDAAVLLTDQLKADLASPDADVRAAAGAVLDRLPSAVNQRFYAWSGLGVNSPVHTHDVSEGRWSGSMYEAGELRLNGELAVDLDRAAIVATLATTLTAASAVSAPVYVGGSVTGAAVLADTYVDEGAPSTQFGDAATLLVQATAGNTDKEALIRLDLSGDEFTQYTTSATLTLPYTVSGPDTAYNAAEILDTHSWDGSASWDENATWDTPVPQNNPASNPDHQIAPWGVYGTGTMEIELDEHVRRQLRRSDMDFSGENTSDPQGKLGDIRAFELAIHDAASYQAAYADKAADASDITDRGDFNGDGQITEHDGAAFLANRGVLPGDFNADGTVGSADVSAISVQFGQPGSFEDGDSDFDGEVGPGDVSTLSALFGLSLSAPVAEELSLRIYGTEGDPEVAYNSRENSGDSPTLDAEHGWDLQLQKLDLDATGSLRVTYNQLNQALTSIEVTLYRSADGVTQGEQVVPTYSLTDLNPGIAKEAQIDYDPNLLAAGDHLIAVISGVGGSGGELQSDNNEAAFGDWRVGSIQVSTLVDDDDGDYSAGDLSLREALALAAALDGDDTISFNQELTGGTIELLHGELEIHSNVSVEGLGAQLLTIDAGGKSRGFYIDPWHVVTLTDLTVSDGSSDGSYGGGLYGFRSDLTLERTVWTGNYANNDGGAVYLREGNLTVVDSTFEGNTTADSGGGVFFYNTGSTHHELLVSGSTFSHNSSSDRGNGLAVYSFVGNGASALVANSTFSNNSGAQGGAIWIQGSSGLDVEILNSTIAQNRTDNSAHPGGVWNASSAATLTINNSIIAGNTDGAGDEPSDIYNAGVLTGSHNLYVHSGGDATSFEAEESNEKLANFADLKLEPLGNYGGPTETHALLPDSPAIDAGGNANAEELDQRGEPRLFDGDQNQTYLADAGAYEYGDGRAAFIDGEFVINGTEEPDAIELTPTGAIVNGSAIAVAYGGSAVRLRGRGGDDVLSVAEGVAVGATLDGGAGADELIGGAGADELLGGPGADTLFGREGADTLSGGEEGDTLYGGEGDDVISGGAGFDTADGVGDTVAADLGTGQAGVDYTKPEDAFAYVGNYRWEWSSGEAPPLQAGVGETIELRYELQQPAMFPLVSDGMGGQTRQGITLVDGNGDEITSMPSLEIGEDTIRFSADEAPGVVTGGAPLPLGIQAHIAGTYDELVTANFELSYGSSDPPVLDPAEPITIRKDQSYAVRLTATDDHDLPNEIEFTGVTQQSGPQGGLTFALSPDGVLRFDVPSPSIYAAPARTRSG